MKIIVFRFHPLCLARCGQGSSTSAFWWSNSKLFATSWITLWGVSAAAVREDIPLYSDINIYPDAYPHPISPALTTCCACRWGFSPHGVRFPAAFPPSRNQLAHLGGPRNLLDIPAIFLELEISLSLRLCWPAWPGLHLWAAASRIL